MTFYTIGHSTRAFEDFLALLRAHGVVQLADVRTVPMSRRHPQFTQESLSRALRAAGIAYRHFAGLGGLRKPRADSRNTAWRHPSFRGYADHMETAAFAAALDELVAWAGAHGHATVDGECESVAPETPDGGRRLEGRPTVIMCAEAVWWQCHRQLIADALVARGDDVRHIMGAAAAPSHKLTEFARVDQARVTYPGVF